MFFEIRASAVGGKTRNGAKTKGRRRRKDEGGRRYSEVPVLRREGNNSCFVDRKARYAVYFSSKASKVPSSSLAEFTVSSLNG